MNANRTPLPLPTAAAPGNVRCETIAQRIKAQPNAGQAHSEQSQFFWVSKGGGRATIDGSVRGFGPSTAIFVPHLTLHRFEFTSGTQGWAVSADPKLVSDLPEQPVLSSVTVMSDQSQLSYLFDAIDREFRNARDLSGRALECHVGLLSIWFMRHQKNMTRHFLPKDSARRRLMRNFVRMLNDRYSVQSSVAEYADALDVTTTHLTRVCRQTTGKPASTLIQDRLIDAARRELTASDQRISQIAANLGFDSPAYFTRLFTQKTGHSPSKFRAQSRH